MTSFIALKNFQFKTKIYIWMKQNNFRLRLIMNKYVSKLKQLCQENCC